MDQDLFKYLPSEITTNILLRLSVRSIAASKCVCKPWLHLLKTDDFVKSHFSKSVPALAFNVLSRDANRLVVSELEEDELDPESHDRRYDLLTKLDFHQEAFIGGSANGLLFLYNPLLHTLYLCNPITREYFVLRSPRAHTFGFGISKVTGQHKVVSIDPCCFDEGIGRFSCHVYTLGTGYWRRVEDNGSFDRCATMCGVFIHGNLHWMVSSSSNFLVERISCFDLETECFSSFTVPPLRKRRLSRHLYSLRDSLCFCDESSDVGGVDIWMMKEYGVEQSWAIQYVITPNLGHYVTLPDQDEFQLVHPLKVFENGEALMLIAGTKFMYYSEKTKSIQEIGGLVGAGDGDGEDIRFLTSLFLTPSLVSLKTVCAVENVILF